MLNRLFSKVFAPSRQKKQLFYNNKVTEINQIQVSFEPLSHDALRKKTSDIRAEIAQHLEPILTKIDQLNQEIHSTLDTGKGDNPLHIIQKKADQQEKLNLLEQEKKTVLASVLDRVLPVAFAIVKETARRFRDRGELLVQATPFDQRIAERSSYVQIQNEQAIWSNQWEVSKHMVVWDMVHYDVQLMGGMTLHQGKIAEMATGEGKTLITTLAAFLNALSGSGVHVVTVNDYLAKRDAEWMGPIFEFHGLSVDCIDQYQAYSKERQDAYQADIIYGTNNEFGFDYLRDNMARDASELVQRRHYFAIVDEVDSVLIDDARTPLIISGPVEENDAHIYQELAEKIEILYKLQKELVVSFLQNAKQKIKAGEVDEGGLALFRAYRGLPKYKPLIKFLSEKGMRKILDQVECYYIQENQKMMPEADAPLFFSIDERQNHVEVTEKGLEYLTKREADPTFFSLPDIGVYLSTLENNTTFSSQKIEQERVQFYANYKIKSQRIHALCQLLKAYALFTKDVDYIIVQGKVKIVDEQTGRVLEGRRYSDGLHQALEAKEGVKVERPSQTYASITLQSYFHLYDKLSGMTGTAETDAEEFWDIYGLEVIPTPTHRPLLRLDKQDKVYKTAREKFNAIIEEVVKLSSEGRPVLVGTTSVEISELVSRMLLLRKVPHQILNAKHHEKEAEVVAEAGQSGTITIATNMAGRGTDIKLTSASRAAGGLAIIGTERHESRRVDRQLRGRSGRQGDPGSSQFFLSLEDSLMRLFGSDRIAVVMDRLGLEEGEVIQHSMVTKSIERAQKKIEQNHFAVRKRLLEYDREMGMHRRTIYQRRNHALLNQGVDLDVMRMLYDTMTNVIEHEGSTQEDKSLGPILEKLFGLAEPLAVNLEIDLGADKPIDPLYDELMGIYEQRMLALQERLFAFWEKQPTLEEASIVEMLFFDGKTYVNASTYYHTFMESKGKSIIDNLASSVVLSIIDLHWKNHLRAMDDLKQSVQNAVYEKQDPIITFKFEAFNLFKKLMATVSQEVVVFLFQAGRHLRLPMQNSDHDLKG